MIEEVRPRIRLSQRPADRERWPPAGAGTREARLGSGARSSLSEALEGGMRLGCRVRHGKFGEGVVLTIEGQGPHARVQVNFERQGSKWLMLQYANLQVV